MRYIIVPIECGDKECGLDCNWEVGCEGAKCRVFRTIVAKDAHAPLIRCPACLEAEQKLAALIKAGQNQESILDEAMEMDSDWKRALAAIKED